MPFRSRSGGVFQIIRWIFVAQNGTVTNIQRREALTFYATVFLTCIRHAMDCKPSRK